MAQRKVPPMSQPDWTTESHRRMLRLLFSAVLLCATRSATGKNLNFVNRYGVTQFRLFFSVDDNDDMNADYMKFFSGNSTSGNRPKLIVRYYVP